MNDDTTSTPDEPDGSGRVATGEQAAIPQQTNGSQPASAAAANAAPGGTTGPDTPAPAGADPAPAEPAAAPVSDPTGSDAPTTQLRVTPASDAGTAPADPASSAGSTARPPAPEPAPGPVPGPGPAAAAPPPWYRMAGRDGADQPTQSVAPPSGVLLDEGPTAILEPPVRPADGDSGSESTGTARSWSSSVRAVRNRPPRQAALQLKRVDPWSALKLGLVLAVVLFFIWMVAIGVLYGALDGMGVWDRLNGTYADLVSGNTPSGSPLISAGRVFGFAAVIGAVNSLLFAVAVTVGAFVYNVSADLVGGIELTLSERD